MRVDVWCCGPSPHLPHLLYVPLIRATPSHSSKSELPKTSHTYTTTSTSTSHVAYDTPSRKPHVSVHLAALRSGRTVKKLCAYTHLVFIWEQSHLARSLRQLGTVRIACLRVCREQDDRPGGGHEPRR